MQRAPLHHDANDDDTDDDTDDLLRHRGTYAAPRHVLLRALHVTCAAGLLAAAEAAAAGLRAALNDAHLPAVCV
jgi:hypothetical protein